MAVSNPSSPSSANSGRARSRASRRDSRRTRSGSAALSSAVDQGSSRSRWGMYTAGSLATVPVSGRCRPQISSSSVDLPQPLGPTTATVSCGCASSDIPSRAATGPRREE